MSAEKTNDDTDLGCDALLAKLRARLGEYFDHGKTLRRLGMGDEIKSSDHKRRGLMMRATFGKTHPHMHGRRWPDSHGNVTPIG